MKLYSIRLRRTGNWNKPAYHLVVTFKNVKTNGLYFEKLGFFSPSTGIRLFFINYERLAFWVMKGAVVSFKVGLLISRLITLKRLNNRSK